MSDWFEVAMWFVFTIIQPMCVLCISAGLDYIYDFKLWNVASLYCPAEVPVLQNIKLYLYDPAKRNLPRCIIMTVTGRDRCSDCADEGCH